MTESNHIIYASRAMATVIVSAAFAMIAAMFML